MVHSFRIFFSCCARSDEPRLGSFGGCGRRVAGVAGALPRGVISVAQQQSGRRQAVRMAGRGGFPRAVQQNSIARRVCVVRQAGPTA